jgi:hypothetical protein
MSWKKIGRVSEMGELNKIEDELTPELDLALREFRLSVYAWSETVMNRPRQAAAPRRQVWRLAAGWALSCALIAGAITAGVFEHRRQPANIAQVRLPEQPRLAVEPGAKPDPKPETKPETKQNIQQVRQEDEELLAKVDSDISRAVPNAMEPLAQMMAWDETKDAVE